MPEGSSAPQATVTSKATVPFTPPPTETPLPTLTPTSIAVDGIAEDAEGNKLAYLNGEWTVLPKLDAEYAKLMVDGEQVVAVDADGEVAFEYDMAAGEWVEVVREPEVVMNTSDYKEYNNAQDAWLKANPWVLESIDWDTFVTDRMSDTEGNPLGYGVLSEWRSDDGEQYVVKLGVVALGGYEYVTREDGSKVYVGVFGIPGENGEMVLLFLSNVSGNQPAFNTWLYKDGVWGGPVLD